MCLLDLSTTRFAPTFTIVSTIDSKQNKLTYLLRSTELEEHLGRESTFGGHLIVEPGAQGGFERDEFVHDQVRGFPGAVEPPVGYGAGAPRASSIHHSCITLC